MARRVSEETYLRFCEIFNDGKSGELNIKIAERLGTSESTVSTCKQMYFEKKEEEFRAVYEDGMGEGELARRLDVSQKVAKKLIKLYGTIGKNTSAPKPKIEGEAVTSWIEEAKKFGTKREQILFGLRYEYPYVVAEKLGIRQVEVYEILDGLTKEERTSIQNFFLKGNLTRVRVEKNKGNLTAFLQECSLIEILNMADYFFAKEAYSDGEPKFDLTRRAIEVLKVRQNSDKEMRLRFSMKAKNLENDCISRQIRVAVKKRYTLQKIKILFNLTDDVLLNKVLGTEEMKRLQGAGYGSGSGGFYR